MCSRTFRCWTLTTTRDRERRTGRWWHHLSMKHWNRFALATSNKTSLYTFSLWGNTQRPRLSNLSICGSKIHLHYLQIVPRFKKWFLLKSNVMLEIRVMHETPLDVSLEWCSLLNPDRKCDPTDGRCALNVPDLLMNLEKQRANWFHSLILCII